jgi:hypothetical protein
MKIVFGNQVKLLEVKIPIFVGNSLIMEFIPGNSLQKKNYSDLIASISDTRFLLLSGPTDYEGILQMTDKSTGKTIGLFMTGDELIADDSTDYFSEDPDLFEMEGIPLYINHIIIHDLYRTELFMNECMHLVLEYAKFRKYQEIRFPKEFQVKIFERSEDKDFFIQTWNFLETDKNLIMKLVVV